jgi:hypothetical protein
VALKQWDVCPRCGRRIDLDIDSWVERHDGVVMHTFCVKA